MISLSNNPPSDKKPVKSNATDYRQRQLVQQSHLRGGNVQVGETFSIKGDAERRQEIEETLERMVENRLVEAEAEAAAMINLAKQEAEATRKQVVSEATARANDLMAQAQSEYEAIRQQAYDEGVEKGYIQGYADATGQVQTETIRLLEGMNAIAEKAIEAKALVIDNVQDDTVALVHYLCKKILHDKIADDPEAYIHLVEEAVKNLKLTGKIQVVVGQETLENIYAFTHETGNSLEAMNRFEWIADPRLEHTELYLLTENRRFSVGVDEQLKQFSAPLSDKALVEESPEVDAEPLALNDLWENKKQFLNDQQAGSDQFDSQYDETGLNETTLNNPEPISPTEVSMPQEQSEAMMETIASQEEINPDSYDEPFDLFPAGSGLGDERPEAFIPETIEQEPSLKPAEFNEISPVEEKTVNFLNEPLEEYIDYDSPLPMLDESESLTEPEDAGDVLDE